MLGFNLSQIQNEYVKAENRRRASRDERRFNRLRDDRF